MKKIALLHTTPVTMEPFKKIAEEVLDNVEIVSILDDSLLKDMIKNSGADHRVNTRIMYYIKSAEAAGCDVFVSACSSIGESVEQCRFVSSIPVLRIDEAMADKAIEYGPKIAVVATVGTTLKPTMNLIKRKADEKHKSMEIDDYLMEEAFKALSNGDSQRHDLILTELLEKLMDKYDAIVLAQASMARIIDNLGCVKKPILTSPELGINKLKEVLETL